MAALIAGIDFSTKAVDIVLLDEDSDAATWHRFELSGQDAFDRARSVRAAMPGSSFWDMHGVLAVGIEDPRGYGAGSLYRVQGAILSRIPPMTLVQPWIPSAWRKQIGLPGNCNKALVRASVSARLVRSGWSPYRQPAAQDFYDAYGLALATRAVVQQDEQENVA